MRTDFSQFPELKAGEESLAFVLDAFFENEPFMLLGDVGVSKTTTTHRAAHTAAVECLILDLAGTDPGDLIGLPYVFHRGGKKFTGFARPEDLPDKGTGLLVLDDFPRAPAHVLPLTTQLILERKVKTHHLGPGWLPCATANCLPDEFHPERLGLPVISRLRCAWVKADPHQWADWARDNEESVVSSSRVTGTRRRIAAWNRQNRAHEAVIDYVDSFPSVFDGGLSNPRAWTTIGKSVYAYERFHEDDRRLFNNVASKVGIPQANSFRAFYRFHKKPLDSETIVEDYTEYRAVLKSWTRRGKLDLIRASLDDLKRLLPVLPPFGDEDSQYKQNVQAFLSDLPGDFKPGVRRWLREQTIRLTVS